MFCIIVETKDKIMKLTAIEIINETVDYYSVDPVNRRSVMDNGACVYNGENGTHCAVGRCMLDKYKKMGYDFEFNKGETPSSIDRASDKSFQSFLSLRYRGHEASFWTDLQRIHDGSNFWDEEGLTPAGGFEVAELKEKYAQ